MAQDKYTVRVTLDLTLNKKLALVSNTTDQITLIDAVNGVKTAALAATDTFSDDFVATCEAAEIWPIGPSGN